ncbi:MAG: 1-acyl-sn-glycerol-3-phosphate acyltransferase [Desulfobacteraceae bacterium]
MTFISKFNSLKTKTRRFIDRILGNDYDRYSCYYPGNTGFWSSILINRITSRINLEQNDLDRLEALKEEGVVIYAGKYKSMFDFLFYHTALKEKGLAYPAIGFDFKFIFLQPVKRLARIFLIQLDYFLNHLSLKSPYASGYISRKLLEGTSGFLFLIERRAFYKRFVKQSPDPLTLLIDLQNKTEKNVYIVPQAIVFGTHPVRREAGFFSLLFGSQENPGIIKRLVTLLKSPDKVSVEIAEPVNLKTFLENYEVSRLEQEFQTHRLRSHLVDIINRLRRSVTGPEIKSRQEITEDILTERSLQEFMADYAVRNDQSLALTHKKAASYIKEIAANYNIKNIQFGELVLSRVFRTIFEGLVIDQEGLQTMKDKSKQAPLILIPCHKSHLDYLLIPYIMYKNKMPSPHIAAGKNLSFWPLGPLFRGAGAFFLRRTFKGAELYTVIFKAYVKKLLFEGFNIKIFIEGGRSRSGKLLSPKFGMLNMVFNAYLQNACDNLYFAPIFVGYDRVLEENSYLKELEGGKKDPENLSQLIKARKFLKKKYGKVYINFGEPISLNDYVREKKLNTRHMNSPETKQVIEDLGYKLINSINSISVVTPHAIIASAILNCYSSRFSKKEMMDRSETYMNHIIYFNANLADTLTVDPSTALNHVIDIFIQRNFLEMADEEEEEISDNTYFIVKDNKRPILDYYKNNSISYFIPAAYTSTSILEKDILMFYAQDLEETYRFLQDLFLDEFSFNEEISCEEYIDKCLHAFMDDGIIVPSNAVPEAYHITSEGLRKLRCFSQFLYPFLESYKTTLTFFEKNGTDKLDSKDLVKKIQARGIKMYKKQQVILKESLSNINYINASNFCRKKSIHDNTNPGLIQYYKDRIEKLLTVLNP